MVSLNKHSIFACLLFLSFWGCSQKEYFKPLEVNGKVSFTSKLPSKIIETNKSGAVLDNSQILSKDGLSTFELQEGEAFIGFSNGVYLVSSHCNDLRFYDEKGSITKTFKLPACPVSASISENQLALVSNENTIYLYDIPSQKEIFSKKSNSAIAVNSMLQAPVFFGDMIYYPMLDGSVMIVSKKSLEVEKTIVIDSAPFFNNVIFLQVSPNVTLLATAKKMLSLYGGNTYSYDAEIRDIKIFGNLIYITTLDGTIQELDFTLKPLRTLKFQFANFSAINITNGFLSVLESGSGYLIKVDLKNFSPKVYKIGISREENVFSQGNKLYYEKDILEFK